MKLFHRMTKDFTQTYRQTGLEKFLCVFSEQHEDSPASGKK